MTQRDAGPEAAEPAARPCPICGRPGREAYRPFCSKRCSDIDLNRWLGGVYAVPAPPDDGETGAGEDLPEP